MAGAPGVSGSHIQQHWKEGTDHHRRFTGLFCENDAVVRPSVPLELLEKKKRWFHPFVLNKDGKTHHLLENVNVQITQGFNVTNVHKDQP